MSGSSKFSGKKLLVLGTSTSSVDIVKYARSEGAYVVVTDYYPKEKSRAKLYADEDIMISTTDVDALCEYCAKNAVNGVFCGVSEVNLRSAYQISRRLDLPCYFTNEQWELLENKAEFKSFCEKHHVPVAKKYNVDADLACDEQLKYPVIVKPVDGSSCRGITICNNAEELKKGYETALSESFSGNVIVEDYIVGDEFTAYYDIVNGECRLSAMGDKYLNDEEEGLHPMPEAFLFPSKHLGAYIKNTDPYVVDMLKSLDLTVATVFIQGITDGTNFAIFEAGLRINGSEMYKAVDHINGVNAMHYLVDYTLMGKVEGDLSRQNPFFAGKKLCYLYLVNKGGVISNISGVEKLDSIPGMIEHHLLYNVGDTVKRTGTLRQRMMRICLICDSAEQLKSSIEQIQDAVVVLDENGENMLLRNFDTQKIEVWGESHKKDPRYEA